jgi:hypothetical protein
MDDAGFTPGVWRHYKGAEYLALGLAREDETDEVVVVYARLYSRDGLPMSTRRLSKWNQMVEHDGRRVPRFEYVGQRSTGADSGAD